MMKLSYLKNLKKNKGMTYVELIVVLSIFATMSGVVLFNHSDFKGRINIKSLSSEIALRIAEAQKNAMAGKNTVQNVSSSWKPAYGIVFDISNDDKSFLYFADTNNNKEFDDSSCDLPATFGGGECLDMISITNGNSISEIKLYYQGEADYLGSSDTVKYVSFTFTRPDSGAVIRTDIETPALISYVEVTITSPTGVSGKINIYPSGRITLK